MILLLTAGGVSCDDNRHTIIGTPVRIGNLEIAEHDFPDKMTWDEAKKACSELGQDWRLPTKSELYFMYLNKNKLEGIVSDYTHGEKGFIFYWSSTESDKDRAYYLGFFGGFQDYGFKVNAFIVRAVRTY